MDKFENHIRKNRDSLDMYDTPRAVWKRVRRVSRVKRISPAGWLKIAAMFLVILTGAAILLRPGFKTIKVKNEHLLHLEEAEIYYNNLLKNLYSEVRPLLTVYPEIEAELFSDISRLDSLNASVRNDLQDNISNQEVIEALIQNYRLKIRILEDMLTELRQNSVDEQNNKDHEL